MVGNTINLKVITPEKIIFTEQVEMVVMPGMEGELGVLAGHMPLVSLLKAGLIKVYKDSKVIKSLEISQGISKINQKECVVIVDSVNEK